jgi:DNA polymerase-4
MNFSPARAIAHFDLDAFFVSVERQLDPSLKGKPLIVGWRSERGVVAASSYETRKYGVHSAMPMKKALKLCPDAVVVPPSREHYQDYSRRVTQMIAEAAPLYEKASIDEFYLDLTGLDRFFGCYRWAVALREKITRETGLPISFALSVNKLVSKIATDTVKPNGQIEVPPGTEKDFLAPLPVEKMPMVGPETTLQLHKMGIFTLAQLAAASTDTLRTFLGRNGVLLHDKANGIDPTPVHADQEQKSISTETTYEEDLKGAAEIESELVRLNKENAYALRQHGKFTCCIAIKVRYADFETVTRQVSVPPLATDQESGTIVRELCRRFYQKNRPVRLLGVRYTQLTDQGPEPDLFGSDDTLLRLNRTIDELRNRFGKGTIGPGKT